MSTSTSSNSLISQPDETASGRQDRFGGNLPLLLALAFLFVAGGILMIALASGRIGTQPTQGLVFTIPAGASETVARPGWDSAIAIPTDIRFDSPAEAVITIKNLDSVTQRAGPFLVGPGQTFTQRFPEPGRYPIVCTVDPLESVVVTVEG